MTSHGTRPDSDPALVGLPRGPYPEALARLERKAIRTRRRAWQDGPPEEAPLVGLGLSGGGIRSATFGLGVIQALAEADLLKRIDLLSTVSGGGYLGSCLGALFCPREADERGNARPAAVKPEAVTATLADPGSNLLRWLREHGRYLTPGGSGDGLRLAAVALRNLVSLQVVLALLAFAFFLAMTWMAAGAGGMTALGRINPGLRALLQGDVTWGHLVPSPLLVLPLLAAALLVVPPAWAYWLVRREATAHPFRQGMPALVLLGFSVACLGPWGSLWVAPLVGGNAALTTQIRFGVGGSALLAVFWWAGVVFANALRMWMKGASAEDDLVGPSGRLTAALRLGLGCLLATLALAAVDTLGRSLYAGWAHWRSTRPAVGSLLVTLGPLLALLALAAGRVRNAVAWLKARLGPGDGAFGWTLVAWAAALVVVLGVLTGASFLAQGIGWGWGAPSGALQSGALGLALVVALLLNGLAGASHAFLNRSSLGPTYAAMLTRAWLGASNGLRERFRSSRVQAMDGDDLPYGAYRPHLAGGPLHLVNVCFNETTGGLSQVVQKDRHGMALAVSPVGMSVGARHHAAWRTDGVEAATGEGGYAVFQPTPADGFRPEALTLGQWMGISGAAASTGMGAHTSLASSVLCGVFNVRLGHWWDSGVDPMGRREDGGGWRRWLDRMGRATGVPAVLGLGVQRYLMREVTARFPGTSDRCWYLSDGGHFENLGGYELIRRRLPLIVLVDAGCDPAGRLDDLEGLVRKARVDFQTRIRFLDRAGALERLPNLDPQARGLVGGLEDLGKEACLALAEAAYPDGTLGLIVYLKPAVIRALDLPLDVRHYHEAHPAFPHEGTGDQFFSEAQWESYRCLGQCAGEQVLAPLLAALP